MNAGKGFGVNVVAVAVLLSAPVASHAQAVFSYKSAAGDYIGLGKSGVLTDKNATFHVGGTRQSARISIDKSDGSESWSIDLAAPQGQDLTPGTYVNAERASFKTGRSPGIDVDSTGRGCNQVWGRFGIRQIAFDSVGNLKALEGSFEQRCESASAPLLVGTLSYQVAPLSLDLRSGPGDWVGQGAAKRYFNDTSIFAVSGTRTYLQYTATGRRDDWMALISPPRGKLLSVGTYRFRRFADSTSAGFDFFGNGRGCNETSGTLKIKGLSADAGGNVKQLYAEFEQYCDGNSAPLKGVIRYGL